MKRLIFTMLTLCGLAALVACAPAPQEGASPEAEPTRPIVEIPVTTDSEEALALFQEGRDLQDAGRIQEANRLYKSAVGQDPEFSYAYLNLSNTAQSAPEFKESLESALAHLDGKSEGEKLLVEINQTFLANDADARMAISRELVDKYPDSPRAWLTRAGVQANMNRHEEARESFRRALELDPSMVVAHRGLGTSYLFNEPRDFQQAKLQMERVIELDPDEAKGYESLGDVYRGMKDLDRALDAYTTAVEKDPELAVARLKKGHINSFLGNYDQARADYDAALATADITNLPSFSNYRALVSVHAGEPEAALAEMEDILASTDELDIPEDQKPGNKVFTLTNMAAVALHHDMSDAAEEILSRRAEVMRTNAEAVGVESFSRQQEADILLWEGRLAARRGDFETAAAKAEEHRAVLANDKNPRKDEGYHSLLGYIAIMKGDYPAAAEHLLQANQSAITNQFHMAMALEGSGRTEEAKALYRRVADWNFNSVDYALVRREAMDRAG